VAAANREVSIEYDDGATVFGGGVATEVQTASLTDDYLATKGGVTSAGVSTALGGGVIGIGLGDVLLFAGERMVFKTFNIQAADQWSASRAAMEEWVMPN